MDNETEFRSIKELAAALLEKVAARSSCEIIDLAEYRFYREMMRGAHAASPEFESEVYRSSSFAVGRVLSGQDS